MKQYATNGRFDIAGFGRLCDVIHVIELCISTHAEMKILSRRNCFHNQLREFLRNKRQRELYRDASEIWSRSKICELIFFNAKS